MIRGALIITVFALTACGADGPPLKPSVSTTVSVGSEGVRTSTGVTVSAGKVTAGASF